MKGIRIFIGGSILLVIAVPLFVAAIWATGVTQSIFGDDFLAGIHSTVIDAVPGLVEDSFAAAQEEGAIEDPIERAWVTAAAQAELTPSQFLEKVGIYKWLNEELAATIDEVGEALRGERDPKEVVLDMGPLKAALTSAESRRYFQGILDRLPLCDREELKRWKELVLHDRRDNLPACNPGTPIPAGGLDVMLARITDVPDQVPVLKDARLPRGANFVRLAGRMVWLVFLLPLVFLLVGGGVAGVSRFAYLGWTGGTLIVGGLIPLFATAALQEIVASGIELDPGRWDYLARSPFWTSKASHTLSARMTDIAGELVNQLFAPVGTIAMTVAGLGLIVVILAFLVPGPRER